MHTVKGTPGRNWDRHHRPVGCWNQEQEARQWLQRPPEVAAAGNELCCIIEEINPRVNYKPWSLGCQWEDCRE